MLRFLTAAQSLEIDLKLMSEHGAFATEQLMELAGLSCAQAIHSVYHNNNNNFNKALICCGPGNNGGDGLVIARHLKHFGFSPVVFYPKKSSQPALKKLAQQVLNLEIPFVDSLDQLQLDSHQLIIDAIFGFSFKGDLRAPFDSVLSLLAQTKIPIVSIDVPSGWNVDEGDVTGQGIKPDVLISLTAPKRCAQAFTGRYHFLGGRFIPPSLEKEYQLNLPAFPGASQFVDITHLRASNI